MKVIFLDLDGVVHDVRDASIWVDPNCVDVLKKVVYETNAKIVVISSRKNDFVEGTESYEANFYYQNFVLPLKNMGIEIYDCTPFLNMNHLKEKEFEIDYYLQIHPEIIEYVILEDDSVMERFVEHQVFIEYSNGLQEEHILPSIAILNGQLGFYPPFYDRSETLKDRTKRILGTSLFLEKYPEEIEKIDRILSRFKNFKKE